MHHDPGWRHLPLVRATEQTSRRPEYSKPEAYQEPKKRALAAQVWQGVTADWETLQQAVAGGRDVGILTGQSRLVILDCDVKRYDQDTGWVVNQGTASWQQGVERHGLDDVARVVKELGHDMAELHTYTVETKSGGCHLYFTQSSQVPLTTSHHRQDWRVDVIASVNSWVAAPPTPGYRVTVDAPCVELPRWFAAWLQDVNHHLLPVGGEHRRRVEQHLRQSLMTWQAGGSLTGGNPEKLGDLRREWAWCQLDLVALANRYGGWNDAIYTVTLNLLEVGFPSTGVEKAVLGAAEPLNDVEQKKAYDTILSAQQRFDGNQRRDGGR